MVSIQLLSIVLMILLSISITLYIFLRKEIRSMADQLKKINGGRTNAQITLSSANREIVDLARAINDALGGKGKSEIEHKKIDLELRQAIANMSHDLRTPLTSIIGYIQLMDDPNLSNDEKTEYKDIVKRRAESLQILISSFYDLSRLEAKEYNFELGTVHLDKILYDLIASFYRDFLNENIEPVIDILEKVVPAIADENAVRRIFSNLIQNALKYGNEFMSISLTQNENYIVTTFTNDTSNLKEEDMLRIFERFFTADRTRSNKSTGLGLAITKELVEQMGHTIYAELSDAKLSIIIKWKIGSISTRPNSKDCLK